MSKAHARICLAGEDLDWAGGKSVLCGIELETTVKIYNMDFPGIFIKSDCSLEQKKLSKKEFNEYKYEGNYYDYVVAGLKTFDKKYKHINSINISITSNIPMQSGLSSSAAVLVALFKELNCYYKTNLNTKELCDLCKFVEVKELGCNVGSMDFYACESNGIIVYDGNRDEISLVNYNFDNDTYIVLIDSGIKSSTKEINSEKLKRFNEKEEYFDKYIEYCNALIRTLILELNKKKNEELIGERITQAHNLMDKYLKNSTELINEIVKLCLKNEAIGAKLTGCGLGGFVFCLIKKINLDKLIQALQVRGLRYLITKPIYGKDEQNEL
ncbi:mevalonate kinase [Clostridium cavendishii DSM 21758]|uniref:Mevalonate kinase n=1 Tax=Clostridium cavendishii DSM 21758 TaxID=1121302 RepID=A0A1M6IWV5_9CLOT|nr:hypothetical protein [Clostridium cavendishii]SHJ38946.1 mevalonate kinase [Clostridium cavendishii DSM 21758]